jgi:hypothetical protein
MLDRKKLPQVLREFKSLGLSVDNSRILSQLLYWESQGVENLSLNSCEYRELKNKFFPEGSTERIYNVSDLIHNFVIEEIKKNPKIESKLFPKESPLNFALKYDSPGLTNAALTNIIDLTKVYNVQKLLDYAESNKKFKVRDIILKLKKTSLVPELSTLNGSAGSSMRCEKIDPETASKSKYPKAPLKTNDSLLYIIGKEVDSYFISVALLCDVGISFAKSLEFNLVESPYNTSYNLLAVAAWSALKLSYNIIAEYRDNDKNPTFITAVKDGCTKTIKDVGVAYPAYMLTTCALTAVLAALEISASPVTVAIAAATVSRAAYLGVNNYEKIKSFVNRKSAENSGRDCGF